MVIFTCHLGGKAGAEERAAFLGRLPNALNLECEQTLVANAKTFTEPQYAYINSDNLFLRCSAVRCLLSVC